MFKTAFLGWKTANHLTCLRFPFLFLSIFAFANIAFSFTLISSCQNLNVANMEYRLTADVTSTTTCFNITAPGVTLDCQGHSLTGNFQVDELYGIYSNQAKTKVINCRISNYSSGVFFNGVNNGEIKNNSVYNSIRDGFALYFSSNNTLTSNKAYNSSINGFYLSSSSNNQIYSNYAYNSEYSGFSLISGSNNTLTSNYAYNSSTECFSLYLSLNNTLTSNHAYNSSYGFDIFSGSNNTLTGNYAYNSSNNGFQLDYSSNNALTSNHAYNSSINGFYLYSSQNNTLTSNYAYNSNEQGFFLHSSSNNVLNSNLAQSNKKSGFRLEMSQGVCQNNSLLNNAAYENYAEGIQDVFCDYSVISNNTVSNNRRNGISVSATNCTVSGNLIKYNQFSGISNELSSNNLFYHNNITGKVWVYDNNKQPSRFDTGLDNANDLGKEGNIYYFANGTPSWKVYDIQDGTPANKWADAGTQRPFDNRIPEWQGGNRDWHPYTEKDSTKCEDANFPACFGTCANVKQNCNISLINETCKCFCKDIAKPSHRVYGMKSGDELIFWETNSIVAGFVHVTDEKIDKIIFYTIRGVKIGEQQVEPGKSNIVIDPVSGKTMILLYRIVEDVGGYYYFSLEMTPDCPFNKLYDQDSCQCECINQSAKQECIANNGIWDDNKCSCSQSCEQSIYPACTGKCDNPSKECSVLSVTSKACSCSCMEAISWFAKINQTTTLSNGLELKLVDIGSTVPEGISIDVYENGKVIARLNVVYDITLIQSFTLPDGRTIHLSLKSAIKSPSSDRVAILLIHPPCPDGKLFNEETCACECYNQTAKYACINAGNKWNETDCTCILQNLTCEQSSVPACFGNCTNSNKTCTNLDSNCSCVCPQRLSTSGIGETIKYKNGYSIRLADISVADGNESSHPAIYDILNPDGKVVGQVKVYRGQTVTFTDPSTGAKVTITVSRTAPGFTNSSKWGEIILYSSQNYLCPGNKTLNETTCACECNQTKKAECKYPNQWDENTCKCLKTEFCGQGNDSNMCKKNCPIETFACTVNITNPPTNCSCNCNLDPKSCIDPKYYNKDACNCECPGVERKIVQIGEEIAGKNNRIKLVSIDTSAYPPTVNLEILYPNGSWKWNLDNIRAGLTYTPFYMELQFKVLKISEDGKWAEIVIYHDSCPKPYIFNEFNCSCACNMNDKWNCEAKGGKLNETDCTCILNPCALNKTTNVCSGDCPIGEACTIYYDPNGPVSGPSGTLDDFDPGGKVPPSCVCMKACATPKVTKSSNPASVGLFKMASGSYCDNSCPAEFFCNATTCTCQKQEKLCSKGQRYANGICGKDDCGIGKQCDAQSCTCIPADNCQVAGKDACFGSCQEPKKMCSPYLGMKETGNTVCACSCTRPELVKNNSMLSDGTGYQFVYVEGNDGISRGHFWLWGYGEYTLITPDVELAEGGVYRAYNPSRNGSLSVRVVSKGRFANGTAYIIVETNRCDGNKTFNFRNCTCECDKNEKAACLAAGKVWDDNSCACGTTFIKQACSLTPLLLKPCPIYFEGLRIGSLQVLPTLYNACGEGYSCNFNTGICMPESAKYNSGVLQSCTGGCPQGLSCQFSQIANDCICSAGNPMPVPTVPAAPEKFGYWYG